MLLDFDDRSLKEKETECTRGKGKRVIVKKGSFPDYLKVAKELEVPWKHPDKTAECLTLSQIELSITDPQALSFSQILKEIT